MNAGSKMQDITTGCSLDSASILPAKSKTLSFVLIAALRIINLIGRVASV
jgi:hypothetical protein